MSKKSSRGRKNAAKARNEKLAQEDCFTACGVLDGALCPECADYGKGLSNLEITRIEPQSP